MRRIWSQRKALIRLMESLADVDKPITIRELRRQPKLQYECELWLCMTFDTMFDHPTFARIPHP